MEQINFNDFSSSCGPTSTPIIRTHRPSRSKLCVKRENYNNNNNKPLTNKELVTQLLEAKEEWPIAFSKVTQNRLNELKLGLDEEFLLKQAEKPKLRRMSPMILNRSRSRSYSRNRDRSMSPSGATKMKESKWDTKSAIAVLLIDYILMKFDDLPPNFLSDQETWKTQSKQFIERLTKLIENKNKLDQLKESNMYIIGQSLRIIMTKMGVLLPEIISKQIIHLKCLKMRLENVVSNDRSKIEAIQILLLHISTPNRILINKLLEMFRIISKIDQVKMSRQELGRILCPSLFEEVNPDNIKLSMDIVGLSDRLFLAPNGILKTLKSTINRPQNSPTNFLLNYPEKKSIKLIKPISTPPSTKPNLKIFHKTMTPITKSISGLVIPSFFPNSKRPTQPESVVLTGFNKISSPKHTEMKFPVLLPLSPKPKLVFTKRKIIEKSLSPFKWSKESIVHNLNDFKKRKLPLK